MNDLFHNKEGYADPTAFEAIKRLDKTHRFKFHPIVYICSPYRGDVDYNTEKAMEYSRFAALSGYLPITPHLLFTRFLNEDSKHERELGLFFGNILLSKCREIWVFGEEISEGMAAEIKHAIRTEITIRHFDIHCNELAKTQTDT